MIKFRSNSRIAACLHPPATPALDAANGPPAWILLGTRVYFADRQNFTTAKAETSKGHAIQLSICFAHPPALSHVCIHCPDLKDADFADEPRVIRSEKQFLLLHLPMNWSTRFVKRSSEYYIYQAIPGKPVLSRIPPLPGPSYLVPYDLGIYCCNDGEYMLAGLCPSRNSGYELYLYSSVSKGWTMKLANLERPPLDEHWPLASHKVILLGGSLLGWVDLWRGMMVCDVLSKDQYVRQWFIPLPGPMPGNEAEAADHQCAWMFRDVTCIDGLLKLIEIEHFQIPDAVEESVAPCDPDRTYDEWCFVRPPPDDPDKKRWPHKLVGWRAAIWNRVLSDDGWRKERDVHVDDILVQNAHHSALLAQLGDDIVGNSTIMNLLPSFPTLSIHGDDVVHMNSKVRLDIEKAQRISVDMRNKTLKTMAPCPVVQHHDYCPHFPCVLSNHLSVTPALPQVVVQASNSENVNVPLHQIGYNGSHHEYGNFADPSYGSYQQPLRVPLQQQPTYQPYWPHFTSWISSGSVNTQQPHPVFNTAGFGQMVHPLPPNDRGPFQPPPQRPPVQLPPFSTMSLSLHPTEASNPVVGGGRRSPQRHSPYQRRRQKFWPPL